MSAPSQSRRLSNALGMSASPPTPDVLLRRRERSKRLQAAIATSCHADPLDSPVALPLSTHGRHPRGALVGTAPELGVSNALQTADVSGLVRARRRIVTSTGIGPGGSRGISARPDRPRHWWRRRLSAN